MATPFRQPIWPGDKGKDILAVKDGLRRMHAQDAGAMGMDNFAGHAFVHCIRCVQLNHGLRVDGIYGKNTHALVAPHFTTKDVTLYKAAVIRRHKPPGTDTTAQAAAQQLLKYHGAGKYRADNPGELVQVEKAARGEAVWSPMGKFVHIDKRIFEMLNFLIGKGYSIGTYAMCSDHPYDSPLGHAGGHAVDISSIDGVGINSQSGQAHDHTLAVAKLLHGGMPTALHPWQLICDGYGYMHAADISACCIPNAAFYGYPTLAQHRNHIHCGYE